MSEPQYASFDDEAVSSALEAARQEFEGVDLRSVTDVSAAETASVETRAQCLELESRGKRVCLKLPFGFPRICVPIDLPDGTIVRVCLYICTFFGIPVGVCVRVYLGGELIAKRRVGRCG